VIISAQAEALDHHKLHRWKLSSTAPLSAGECAAKLGFHAAGGKSLGRGRCPPYFGGLGMTMT
jgi:hypothetical protein